MVLDKFFISKEKLYRSYLSNHLHGHAVHSSFHFVTYYAPEVIKIFMLNSTEHEILSYVILFIFAAAGVASKRLPVHHYGAVYIFGFFGIIDFIFSYSKKEFRLSRC